MDARQHDMQNRDRRFSGGRGGGGGGGAPPGNQYDRREDRFRRRDDDRDRDDNFDNKRSRRYGNAQLLGSALACRQLTHLTCRVSNPIVTIACFPRNDG